MNLIHSSDQEPGFSRRPWGKGFTYLDPEGNRLPDGEDKDRIISLVIPPAYQDVWVCLKPNGHLQATGRDERKRKQYRYHEEWLKKRNAKKFESLAEFAEHLPDLREKLDQEISKKDLSRNHVAALVLKIIDETGARVGSTRYREENGTHGITTLRRKHLSESGKNLELKYKGKHGKKISLALDEPELLREIHRCEELPGEQLFEYRNQDGETRPLESSEVNDFLHETCEVDFTAKTFRTWRGSVLAFSILSEQEPAETKGKRKSQETAAVRATAKELHNTMATCRNYYVHPLILKSWMDGTFPELLAKANRSRSHGGIEDHEERLFAKFLSVA